MNRWLRILLWTVIACVVLLTGLLVVLRPRRTAPEPPRPTAWRGRIFTRDLGLVAYDDTSEGLHVRRYPAAETLANVLGFIGGAGLEYSLDSLLRPKSGSAPGQVVGLDIDLTIDLAQQRTVFRLLRQYVGDTRSARGAAIVLAPGGEILALADYPGYDPYRYKLYPQEVWRCLGVMSDFEPGPSFQIVPVLAQARADTAKARSLNPAALDPVFVADAATRLGFGRRTGVELLAEAQGAVPEPIQFRTDSGLLGRVTQGAGVRVTLLQLAQAYAGLARNVLHPPFLVARVRTEATALEHARTQPGPLLTEAQLESARDLLSRRVATRSGAVNIIGQGGSVPQSGPGGLERVVLCAAGFLASGPGTDSGPVVAVMLDQPLTGHYTEMTASQLCAELLQALRVRPRSAR